MIWIVAYVKYLDTNETGWLIKSQRRKKKITLPNKVRSQIFDKMNAVGVNVEVVADSSEEALSTVHNLLVSQMKVEYPGLFKSKNSGPIKPKMKQCGCGGNIVNGKCQDCEESWRATHL